ncbi:cdc42-interacting protein 4 homolog isoform X2 [Mya arenaria]|uniref:cdc42-interacting protein 4 homolog isoform X2 n=1 Tax=Mya arenaria TaxID=6604 RepID=UPI0022E81B5B|nr:cdc42-interacting protein 4 homolog isoform X2 [Mya arenaria]
MIAWHKLQASLKDKYDCVGKHTEKGIDFLDKYSNFLKKRCDIEGNYANELKRLVKNFQPKKKEEDDYQFTAAQGFLNMLKEVHDMAGQHEVIAENTQQQLIVDIQKCVIELKQERKKALVEGSKVQDQLKNVLRQLENSKKNYEKKFLDSERALEAFKRADADINLSRADVEKTRSTSMRRQQECEDSKNEYASQLQTTNKFQHEYYTQHMPQVFKQLQDVDERRITKMKMAIEGSAGIENNVLPIIKSCIDGMNKAAAGVNHDEDTRLVIEKYRTGFQIPGPIPFEDLSNGPSANSNNVINTPDNRTVSKNSNKAGTIGKKKKNRSGILKIFGTTNQKDEPPAQRKAKLLKKIDEIRGKIEHETNEREGMIKMKEVFTNNNQLGDPNTIIKQLEKNAETLNQLQSELKKIQDALMEAENEMSGTTTLGRHGSDDSMTPSVTSIDSNNVQVSAPGTPSQLHQNQEEYYDPRYSYNYGPVEDPAQEPEPFTPDPEFDVEYPVIGSCRALYPFEATAEGAVNEGSVSMTENEEMSVLEQDQGDGWTRVRRSNNEEGFVPTSYIQCHFYDQDAV